MLAALTVHRAEITQLKGAWSDAIEEARSASRRAALDNHRGALAEAAYFQGEVHRLRGSFAPAEEAYREASRSSQPPPPSPPDSKSANTASFGSSQ